MSEPLFLLYVPGLGDDKVSGQRKAVSSWRLWGVEAELFQMCWADKESWEAKFGKLLDRIDEISELHHRIALVGASAGAAAVINAFAARKTSIVGCVLIAGKVNRPEAIGQRVRENNPAFVTAAYNCQKALASLTASDRQRVLSVYAVADETVHKPDSRIAGAKNRLSPTISHFFTIGFQLIFGAPSFIKFLKYL